jgi:hypothetical protein
LFTWDGVAPEYNYRELDIEFSKWGEDTAPNSQYVVQPWSHVGNRHQFIMTLESDYSTHAFNWQSGSVEFASYQGHTPAVGDEVEAWLYSGPDIPPAGTGNARINLWLLNGYPLAGGSEAEIIFERFDYMP